MSQPRTIQQIAPLPFAIGASQPFTDNQPWLGGWLRILGPQAASANNAIAHGLRVKPRFAWLLDAGTIVTAGPLPRGTTAWSATTIYLVTPLIPAGQSLTLLIA